MPAPPLVRLIAGPTASGKSALALELAAETGAAIVNADSMQLYRDLRILTARPSPEEETRADHRLYGVADAAEAWSVGRWLRTVADLLAEFAGAGRPAILVGGTGLYFRALTHGLADVPAVPDPVRATEAERYDREGETAYRVRLAGLDPAAESRIAPGDRQRLVRAAAVAVTTGKPLTAWRAETRPLLAPGDYEASVLEPDRAALYARCDARLDAMIEGGALDEVAALHARGLDPALPALKAVGYRELAAHVTGDLSRDEALAAARQATRNYAKRQLTWFRNQTPDWRRSSVA
jgi:tRNA dimethylallyltransferase